MSKVTILVALMLLITMTACQDDPPVSPSPTATPSPIGTLQAAPQATSTSLPIATPTATATAATAVPTATATPEVVDSRPAHAIVPLKVDDPQAFLTELSPRERSCLDDNVIVHQEIEQITRPTPGGSPDATAVIICCLRDEIVLAAVPDLPRRAG